MPVNFANQLPHKPESFGEQVHAYYEPELYAAAIELLRGLAVRTGAIFEGEAAGWNPSGSYAFVVEELDGKGYIGFRPENPVLVNATKESDV